MSIVNTVPLLRTFITIGYWTNNPAEHQLLCVYCTVHRTSSSWGMGPALVQDVNFRVHVCVVANVFSFLHSQTTKALPPPRTKEKRTLYFLFNASHRATRTEEDKSKIFVASMGIRADQYRIDFPDGPRAPGG